MHVIPTSCGMQTVCTDTHTNKHARTHIHVNIYFQKCKVYLLFVDVEIEACRPVQGGGVPRGPWPPQALYK